MRYKSHKKRLKPVKYQATEDRKLFSEKEFIIRSNGQMKVFKISARLQAIVFSLMVAGAVWTAYSYRMYSVSDRIISYQSKELDETRSAYVDLMSDFVSVHKNITSMVQSLGNEENKQAEEIDVYLRKAEVIEEKIKNITANEDWIDEKDLGDQSALKDAEIDRDVAIKTNDLLKQKIEHLEGVISSLQSFELDVLKKIENISDKEIDKIKSSISTVNSELKKRGKYFNPLANSKKDNKGGVFVPDSLSVIENDELSNQALKTFSSLDDNRYYKEAMKKVPLGKPVWTYWLSSPFGKRKDPLNKKSATHKGVDLASNTGNKIKTMAEGKVTRAGWASGYGKVIEIDHGNGFKTKYGHLNKIYVNKGQQVAQNEAIGEVGNTGRSTGPHLHYEVLYNGAHLNPMVFIKAK